MTADPTRGRPFHRLALLRRQGCGQSDSQGSIEARRLSQGDVLSELIAARAASYRAQKDLETARAALAAAERRAADATAHENAARLALWSAQSL